MLPLHAIKRPMLGGQMGGEPEIDTIVHPASASLREIMIRLKPSIIMHILLFASLGVTGEM